MHNWRTPRQSPLLTGQQSPFSGIQPHLFVEPTQFF
jgi:hypothetical protein